MDKFIRTLKEINKNTVAIEEELRQSKQRNSAIVNTKIKDAYPEMKETTTKELIFAIWNNLLKRASRKHSRTWQTLLVELDKILKMIYPNKLTLRGVLVELRRPLKDFKKWDKTIYDQTIVVMGMTLEESKEESRKYKATVEARNVARGGLPPIYVEDIYTLLDTLIKSENAYELTLAVELATGSRSIEVFKVSEYKEIEGHPEQISVKGIAKDKVGNNLINVVLTRNLVHLKAKQIITAVAKLRILVNVEGTNKEISQRTNKHLNKKFREFVKPLAVKNATEEQKQTEEYKNYIKTFTSHKTRYLYGNASYLIYAKSKNIPLETYIQGQLGHLSGDSTRSYLGVNVKFRHKLIKDVNPELKEIIQSIDNKVKKIENEVNACCNDDVKTPGAVNVAQFRNSFSRRESTATKIEKVVNAIKEYQINNTPLPRQSVLGKILGFGGGIMTAGYGEARRQNVI